MCRVKPEAQGIAELHKGGNMSQLITNNSSCPQSARPAPRVKVEASDTAEMGRGLRMSCLLHDAKSLPATPKPMPRVKPEAGGIAELGAGSQMAKVMFKSVFWFKCWAAVNFFCCRPFLSTFTNTVFRLGGLGLIPLHILG